MTTSFESGDRKRSQQTPPNGRPPGTDPVGCTTHKLPRRTEVERCDSCDEPSRTAAATLH